MTLCAWRDIKKIFLVDGEIKWNFKQKISPIFHFYRVNDDWVSGLVIEICFTGKGLRGRFTVKGLKPKKKKKNPNNSKKLDEDEVDYVPKKTARDEAK